MDAEPKRKGLFKRFQTRSTQNLRSPLCDTCRSIDIYTPRLAPTSSYSVRSLAPSTSTLSARASKTVVLGTYSDLVSRPSCPCCRLMLHLVRRIGEGSLSTALVGDEDSDTPAVYELQHSNDGFEVRDVSGTQGYIYFAGHALAPGASPTSPGISGPTLDISRVRSWLSDCETQHVNCGVLEDALPTNDPLAILLVDVRNRCLVKANTNHRYLALSYVRGGVRSLETTKANADALREDGALDTQRTRLSKVVDDALRLVVAMRERYLWVENLSIVQDDTAHKSMQVDNMHKIFGRAAITIVAAAGKDANSGLNGVRPGTRLPYLAEETIQGTRFVARPANLPALLEHGSYGNDAQAYQQRILSRRCLILTPHQAYFHCQSTTQTDADGCQSRDTDLEVEVPGNPLMTLQMERSLDGINSPDPFIANTMLLYDWLVRSSTSRYIPQPTNSLSAFTGISTTLKSCYETSFIAGLPEAVIDAALLWVTPNPTTTPQSRNLIPRTSRPRSIPSWSWASQSSGVSYLTGPLASTLHTDSPGIRSEVGSIYLRSKHRLRLLDRTYGDLVQKQRIDSAQMSDDAAFPNPILGRDVDTLCFTACVAPLSAFRIRAFEWDDGRVLIYTNSQKCCGKIWPDDPASFAATDAPLEAGVKREFVLLSSTRVPNVAEHLGLGYHFAADVFPEGGLVNVLVVEWKGDYAERLGVGQIHEGAWEGVQRGERGVVLV